MSTLDDEEDSIRDKADGLDGKSKKAYFSEVSKSLKDPDTYSALNYVACLGLHHFYIGNYYRGFFNLILGIVAICMFIDPKEVSDQIGLALVVIIALIELPQMFFKERIIKNHNNQIMLKILDKISEKVKK